MQSNKPWILSKKGILTTYAVLIIFMVIGTFLDFRIDTVLNAPSNFLAVAVAHYGLYPAVLVTFVSLVMFLKLVLHDKKDIPSWICLVLNLYMAYTSVKEFRKLFKNDTTTVTVINLIIGVAIAVIFAVIVFRKLDVETNPKLVRGIAMVLLFAFSTQFILINKVIKTPWGRPRFRLLLTGAEGVAFRPWYAAGLTANARELIAAGLVKADEFKSFPSGHAGCAAALVMLVLLCKVVPAWKDKETVFTVIGVAWALLTILGRMVAGAHFLTDVTMATLIMYTAFVLFAKLLLRPEAD